MSEISYFKVHLDTKQIIEDLPLEDIGRIFLAMYDFAENNTTPDFPKGSPLKIAGSAMIATIDRAKRKYNKRLSDEERREINRANGKKGGAPKGNQNAKKKTATDQNVEQKPERPKKWIIDLIEQMDNSLQQIGTGLMNLLSSRQAEELVTAFLMYFETEYEHDAPFDNLFNRKNNIGAYDFRDMVEADKLTGFIKDLKKAGKDLWTEDLNATVDEYQDAYSDTKSDVKYALEYMDMI